jgi:hypothetical protein
VLILSKIRDAHLGAHFRISRIHIPIEAVMRYGVDLLLCSGFVGSEMLILGVGGLVSELAASIHFHRGTAFRRGVCFLPALDLDTWLDLQGVLRK